MTAAIHEMTRDDLRAIWAERIADRDWERQRPDVEVLDDPADQARRVRELARQNRSNSAAEKVERLHAKWGITAGGTIHETSPENYTECWFCDLPDGAFLPGEDRTCRMCPWPPSSGHPPCWFCVLPAGRRSILHDKMHGHDCPAKGDEDCDCYPKPKKAATGSGRPLTEDEAAVLDRAREGRQDGVNEANEAAGDGLVRFAATASPMATLQAMLAYSTAHRLASAQGQDAYHANREGNRAALAAWKVANGCVNHPEIDNAAALELDHRDPVEKARQDDRGSSRGGVLIDWKHERFLRELSKCDVLCKPCHREKTRRERAEIEELLLTNHEAKNHHVGERVARRAVRRGEDEELLIALWEAWPRPDGDWVWWAPTSVLLESLGWYRRHFDGKELDGQMLGQAIRRAAKRHAPSAPVPKSSQQPGGDRERGWSRDVLQPLWDTLLEA